MFGKLFGKKNNGPDPIEKLHELTLACVNKITDTSNERISKLDERVLFTGAKIDRLGDSVDELIRRLDREVYRHSEIIDRFSFVLRVLRELCKGNPNIDRAEFDKWFEGKQSCVDPTVKEELLERLFIKDFMDGEEINRKSHGGILSIDCDRKIYSAICDKYGIAPQPFPDVPKWRKISELPEETEDKQYAESVNKSKKSRGRKRGKKAKSEKNAVLKGVIPTVDAHSDETTETPKQ